MFAISLVVTFFLITPVIASSNLDSILEEMQPPHRITLSKLVAAQRITDDYPFAPPNTPISPIVRAMDDRMDKCFAGVTRLILAMGDVAIRILTALNR